MIRRWLVQNIADAIITGTLKWVVTEIFQDNIFFSARSSSNSFKQAPRKPSTGKPEDTGTGIRPLYISIARTLANHARGYVSHDKAR